MNKVKMKPFKVIGIAVRTTNENGKSVKDIEALWEKFWNENIRKQILNKMNDETYVVYTDYETDFTGSYTTIIGVLVNSLENIPEGCVGITIEAEEYQKFVSKGKMPEAVFNTWLEIWGNKTLNRAYQYDFTVYGTKYHDGDNAEAETYISVR